MNSRQNTPDIKRNPRGRPISRNQKEMIINLYNSLQQEVENIEPSKTRKKCQIADMISGQIGISSHSIRRIINEYKESGMVKSPKRKRNKKTLFERLDTFDKDAIRAKVHAFFRRKEIPTIKKIARTINDDETLPNISCTSLFRLLRKMEFKFKKRYRKCMLIDRDDIVAWRHHYLRQIRKYRADLKKIYYQDETWLNSGHTVSKVLIDDSIKSSRQAYLRGLTNGLPNPSGKGNRLIISHIGSDTGFVDGGLFVFESKNDGDYHKDMNAEVFETWISSVLSELEPGSVVVLDNAPYHSRKTERIPNTSTKKADILEWLRSKGITDAHENELKKQLLERVKRFNYKPAYAVDEIIEASGRIVLRLPPYHCILNPIELIWAQIKGYVARNNHTFTMNEAKQLLVDAISQVTPERWKACVDHVRKIEEEMRKLDDIPEIEVQPMIIDIGGSDSDDSDGFGF